MPLSVVTPIAPALQRTRDILFRPFSAQKWFKLGFCAFLATLGGNCGGTGGGSWDNPSSGDIERGRDWVGEHLTAILTIGAIVLTILLAIWVTLTWLRSRGRFMFLDGVVRNRGAVVEPWNTYRAEGDSLFRFSLVLHFTAGVLLLCTVAFGVVLAWSDIQGERFDEAALVGLIVSSVMILGLALTFAVIGTFLNDFVVPAMYQGHLSVGGGWRVVQREVFAGNAGTLVLYLLMKVAIFFALASLTIALVCVTLCTVVCLLVIPYVGTVLVLPFFVFERCYSLCFLEQLGGRWKLFGPTPPAGTAGPELA